MTHGTRPTPLDHRDFSYHRSFGAITPAFQDNFTVDIGLTNPNQITDGLLYACTGYTQTDNENDEDILVYDPAYTYSRTCYMEGHDQNTGCDIRTSLKSTRVYGLKPKDAEDTDLPVQRKGGNFYNIYDDGGADWFDSIRSAILREKKGVSIGSPWFSEWTTPQNGVLTSQFVYDGNPYHYSWHNWAIKGWKTVEGVPYLLCKSWQGRGFDLLSRETINKVMDIRGSVAFIQAKSKPSDIRAIKIGTIEYLLIYLYRLVGKMRLN